MELIQVKDDRRTETDINSVGNTFIEANTTSIDYRDLRDHSIIPVFSKDNESTISHAEFIDTVLEVTRHHFNSQQLTAPSIRVSHPIKGRIPEAMGKPANMLLDNEKTIYYERMAFMIEIPTITEYINGNRLTLTVGGVRAYNQENLYNRKTEERFKVFIGYKNMVCVNLCISTDGCKTDIRVRQTYELMDRVNELLTGFQSDKQLVQLSQLNDTILTESQFAQLIGRSRMYHHLPSKTKQQIPAHKLMDNQLNTVVREYYRSDSFSRNDDGSIDLWKLFKA